MGRWLAAFMLLASACIEDPTIQCGDGTACAVGFACSPIGCLSPLQLEACKGLTDGDVCTLGGEGGFCQYRGCIVARCGNGVVEPPEVCDDSNQDSRDGCNATCTSTEICGNGIVELVEECDGDPTCSPTCKIRRCGNGELDPGETCDDDNQISGDGCSGDCRSQETCGNEYVDTNAGEECDSGPAGLAADGCTSTCSLEVAQWTDVSPIAAAATRRPAMTFDSARGRVVMFGGLQTGSITTDALWEWEGATWIRRSPLTSPGTRESHAMAYDEATGESIMFGGNTNSIQDPYPTDTWAWDGANWRLRTPAQHPTNRRLPAMAYDRVRQEIVMFGGYLGGTNNALDETWVWTGSNWIQRTTSTQPPAGVWQMAWDDTGKQMVLFAYSTSPAVPAQTWTWDGSMWSDVTAKSGAPTVDSFSLRMSQAPSGTIVLLGNLSGGMETWKWASDAWTLLTPATQPTKRSEFGMTWDALHDRVVLFGGTNATTTYGDTWSWNGTTWASLTPLVQPPASIDAPIAYVPATGTLMLYGGTTAGTFSPFGETWIWDGEAWTRRTVSGPGNRGRHAVASMREGVLLFGADGNGGPPLSDTWKWDGFAWTKQTPATTTPPGRYWHAMAYDRARDRVVMFGGYGPSFVRLADTWEWNGSDWVLRTPAHAPSARSSARMAYDERRQRVVLFGGSTSTGGVTDTWEWDGNDWTQVAAAGGPMIGAVSGMAYHAARGRVVIAGYYAEQGTWEWTGQAWQEIQPVTIPTQRSLSSMAYDATRGELVLYGGYFGGADKFDTWTLAFGSAATVHEACLDFDADGDGLVGCADPDCWARCTPECPPATSCAPSAPHCGDGSCSSVETRFICPSDCP